MPLFWPVLYFPTFPWEDSPSQRACQLKITIMSPFVCPRYILLTEWARFATGERMKERVWITSRLAARDYVGGRKLHFWYTWAESPNRNFDFGSTHELPVGMKKQMCCLLTHMLGVRVHIVSLIFYMEVSEMLQNKSCESKTTHMSDFAERRRERKGGKYPPRWVHRKSVECAGFPRYDGQNSQRVSGIFLFVESS